MRTGQPRRRAEFKFAVKAHQKITHILRLKNADEMVRAFLSSVGPLHQAGKLGPILFQLPPNLKCSLELLDGFLRELPRAPRYTFEFRHDSWFADAVYDLLRKHNVALCVAESEDRTVPDETTADFSYYRFRQPEYSAEQRGELTRKISARVAEGKDVFAYFKHEESPQGALYAEELLQAVKGRAQLRGNPQKCDPEIGRQCRLRPAHPDRLTAPGWSRARPALKSLTCRL